MIVKAEKGAVLKIGRLGENEARVVCFDAFRILAEFPGAAFTVLNRRPQDAEAYPVNSGYVEISGGNVFWTVTSADLSQEGLGECELVATVDNAVVKSEIWQTRIMHALDDAGDPPDPWQSWVQDVEEAADRAEAAAELLEHPGAEAETLAPGSEATASYADGMFSFGIPRGADGTDGQDGYSPSASVSKSGNKATITITDKNGTTTAEVTDGADGRDGTDGQDGYSPTASVTKSGDTATISITDKNGTTTAQISDGETGATPVISIGTVTTLQPGSDATASMDTTDPEHPVLSFGIPEGEPGEVTEAELNAVAESKADIIHDTASGSIATFPDGADSLPMSVTAEIVPVQDLHGQESPYPAGSGKNKLPLPVAETKNGVTLVRNADGSVTLTGTASNHTYFDFFEGNFNSTAFAGYKFTATSTHTTWGTQSILFRISASNRVSIQETQGNREETIADNGSDLYFAIRIANGYAIPSGGVKIYPMLRASGESDTFAPYSNLCPITGWSGANLCRTGKNLMPDTVIDYSINADGTYGNDSSFVHSPLIMVESGKTYTITGKQNVTNSNKRVHGYSLSGQWVEQIAVLSVQSAENYTITFTVPNNVKYIAMSRIRTDTNVQLEEGTATAYEQYTGEVYPITFPSTVYGGNVKVNKDGSRKLVIGYGIATEDIFTGNVQTGSTMGHYISQDNTGAKYVGTDDSGVYCNMVPVDNASGWSRTYSTVQAGGVEGRLRVYGTFTTLAEFKQQFAGLQIVYPLATPVEIDLTDSDAIVSLLGVNNVWADCGPVSVEYPADTKLYIDGKIAELQALILENISNS